MDLVILGCLFVQIALVAVLVRRLRIHFLSNIGSLFISASVFYGGITEVVQAIFPGRNDEYRSLITPGNLREWVLLETAGLVLFTATYLLKLSRVRPQVRIGALIANLDRSYLLKWQVLLALGVPSFILIALKGGSSGQSNGYWAGGLTDQFTPMLLILALSTFCVKYRGKWFLLVLFVTNTLLVASGQRRNVATATIIALTTMIRYGIPTTTRKLAGAALMLVGFAALISAGRASQGRFTFDDTFSDRLDALLENIRSPQIIDTDSILSDTVYRFDGNTYGAMIISRQNEGYGITGAEQLGATLAYMTPAFLFPGKRDLDDHLKDEEAYDDWYYELPDLDYLPTIWTCFLAYTGSIGLLVLAMLSGWLIAIIDDWLARKVSVNAYLTGIWLAMIPVQIEQGISGVIYICRGLIVMIICVRVFTRGLQWRASRSSSSPLPQAT